MPLTFGVVGYSTRAIVQAVKDLGHRAIALDAFNDQDTLDAAERVILITDWPGDVLRAAKGIEVDAWLLAGGIENHAEIVAGIRRSAPVLGPDDEQLRKLRSPDLWASLCEDGIHWPATVHIRPSHDLAHWLLKPFHGGGGQGVRRENAMSKPAQYEPCYWQRCVEGRVLGVSWVMNRRNCRLIGVTQSLGKDDWPGPTEFIYRGSIGPVPLRPEQLSALARLGCRVVNEMPDYRGYLQADFIEDGEGRLWLLEFNPRWTSGMEILHHSAPFPECTPLGEHLRAWGVPNGGGLWRDKPQTKLVAKAVYYAAADIDLTHETRRSLRNLLNWQTASSPKIQWSVADLPEVTELAPMRFEMGRPILTLRCRFVEATIRDKNC